MVADMLAVVGGSGSVKPAGGTPRRGWKRERLHVPHRHTYGRQSRRISRKGRKERRKEGRKETVEKRKEAKRGMEGRKGR
jgi:hypothetical protein